MTSWLEWIDEMWTACPGMRGYGGKEKKEALHKSLLIFTGRLFKEGHSCFISTEPLNNIQWLEYIAFFHNVRLGALNQQLVGSYLNVSVFEKKTLLLIGDEYRFKNILSDKNGHEPYCANVFPRSTRASQIGDFVLKGDLFNTLIIGKNMMSSEKIEALSLHYKPFVILFDVTQSGFRNELSEYWDYMSCYFPNTPKFAIGTSGDLITHRISAKLTTHKINFRLGDLKQLKPSKNSGIAIQYVFSKDIFFNNIVSKVTTILYNLKKSGTSDDNDLRKTIYKALNLLENTVVPHDCLKLELQKSAYNGQVPIASIAPLIKNVKGKNFQDRNTQQYRDEIVTVFETYSDAVEVNGKTNLLLKYISEQLGENNRLIILVDNQYHAKSLFNYFSEKKIKLLGSVKIIHKSINPYKEFIDGEYNELVITCKLWERDLIWLTLPVNQVTFIAYSHEEKWLDLSLNKFNQSINGVSKKDGDKLRLLKYDFNTEEFLSDECVEEKTELNIIRKTDSTATGIYKQQTQLKTNIAIDQFYLFEEMEAFLGGKNGNVLGEDYAQMSCEVMITVSGGGHIICLHPDQYAQIICATNNDSPLLEVRAEELEVGQNLVIMRGSDPQKSNLLDIIFEGFTAPKDFLLDYQLSEQWYDLIDTAAIKYGEAKAIHKAIHKYLKADLSEQTIQAWLSHRLYPSDKDALIALAKICDHHAILNSPDKIFQSISKIRSIRNQIGKAINKSLRLNLSAEHSYVIYGNNISNEFLRDLISVSEIIDITIPQKVLPKKLTRMSDLIPLIKKKYSKQLILTNSCEKSMLDSPFENLKKAERCFELLATTFMSHFEKEIRLHELMKLLKKDDIDYARGTSDITKGKTGDYKCTYHGRKFEVNKHLSVGTSYEPNYTLRVYFEWLEDEHKILICHAGRHKKT